MNRRIVKLLTVLLVLLCILPVVAGAAEYQVGDTIWTNGAEPTADTEQYSRWIPVIRSDGVQEYREAGKTGVYEYQWIVEEYYGPGKREGIPTSFTVKNLDDAGKPMVGTEFILFEERGENLLLIASATTDHEGVAHMEDLCLDDNSDTAVWHLVQTDFPESKMADTHHPYTGMWDVYVTRDSSGEHTLEMEPSPAAQTMSLRDDAESDPEVIDFMEASGQEPVEDHYSEQENELVVVNAEIKGKLTVRVAFEDNIVPANVDTFEITITPPNGFRQTFEASIDDPEVRLKGLPLGSYTIEEKTGNIKPDDYNLKTTYTVERIDEDPYAGQTVTLTEEKPAATVTVTNCYEEINIANTVLAKVIDEEGSLLDGAAVELLDESGNVIRTVSASSEKGTFVFDDLADYAVKDKTVTFKIRQSKAPAGYKICEDQYKIKVEKKNGKVTVSAQRDANLLARLFRSGEETGPNGETVIKFVNEADLADLTIKVVNQGVACPVDSIPVTIIGQNYKNDEIVLSESNGWQVELKDLPKSQYTIKQDADANGYRLTSNYTASGGFITNGNHLDLVGENAEVTITNTYTLQTGKLQVQMAFVEDLIPDAITRIPVKITGASVHTQEPVEETIYVTAAKDWKAAIELPLGTYTVEQDVSNAKADGYELIPDADTKTVMLRNADEEEICTITNQYKPIEKPVLEKITIQVKNQAGDPIQGCTVGLFMGEDKVPKDFPATDANGQIVIDDLKSSMALISGMLEEGDRQELTLKQIAVPEGYEISAKTYEIYVEKNGEELTYGITGADTSGTEITLTFTNSEPVSEDFVIPGKVVIQMNDSNGEPIQGGTIGLYMDGDKLPKSFPATDANGQIVIDDLQGLLDRYSSMLPEGETKVTLQQIAVPEGYELTTDKYDIVVQNNNGEISYTIPGADINTERILLTFPKKEIEAETGELHIKVEFEGKPTTADVTQVEVSVGSAVKNYVITATEGWDVIITGIPVGNYTISQKAIKVTGYKVATTCDPKTVTITANDSVNCTITNKFTKSTSTSTSGSSKKDNQIGIRTLDSNGAPLAGAKYGLFHGATAIRSYTDYGTGQINIEDLDMLLGTYVNDPTIMDTPLTLQQTQPPIGGERSTKTYDVYISAATGKVNVKGSEIDANGVQLVDFIHNMNEEEDQQQTQPTNTPEEKEPPVIVIRTVDESGNALTGAEYCLSTDLRFDKDKDIVYSHADRHDEITIEDLEELLGKEKSVTYYLLQSRQPENGSLSVERYVVELSKKKNDLKVEIKKDAGILERLQGGGVEETTTGEWIVTFCCSAKTTTIQIDCEEIVNWNKCLEAPDVLQQYKKNEYEFQMNWEYAGEKKDPMSLKLSNGEMSGTFDPIPYGAKYEIVPVQDGCYKMEFTKGDVKGVASKDNQELQAKVTYNIDMGEPLTIEMMKIDSRTERPLPGVVYTLKNSEQDEVDAYKTNGSGKLLIDAITEPGEYILTESELPDGYKKLKKDIGISVAVAFKEARDEKGDPMIVQTLEAVVSHSQVKQHTDGSYRIGTAQRTKIGKLPIILGVSGAVAVAGAGAGVAMLQNKKKRSAKR